jgi:hypothetical protein
MALNLLVLNKTEDGTIRVVQVDIHADHIRQAHLAQAQAVCNVLI